MPPGRDCSVTLLHRRSVLWGLAASALPFAVRAEDTITDGAGRKVTNPAKAARVLPAGPPAAILLYTLAPDLLAGWPRMPRPNERVFLLPDVMSRPEIGRITGRGNTANLEVIVQMKPDLILDAGATTQTFVSMADRVQEQTGVPYALLDGRIELAADTYRTLGKLLRREADAEILARESETILRTVRERVAKVPNDKRPRVYYARGPRGLETGLAGSINVESIEIMGARNVASGQRGGLTSVSLEQVLAWDPEVIVTIEESFADAVRNDPNWAAVSAVKTGRVHLAPKLPFGWIDFPPSVNRLIGLPWLGKIFYPEIFTENLKSVARAFYSKFYHVEVSDAQLDSILAGRG